jgi:hypothetical protein
VRTALSLSIASILFSNLAMAQTPISPASPTSEIVISQPGSYILTGNKFSPFGIETQNLSLRSAIRIDASNVVLDLGGYTIGYPLLTCTGTTPPIACSVPTAGSAANNKILAGVSVNPSATNVTIRNGNIQGTWNHGIDCGTACTIDNVNVRLSNGFGIKTGARAQVQNVAIEQTAGYALQVSSQSLVKNVRANTGNGYGIWASTDANIEDVVINNFGETGIATSMGSSIHNCVVARTGITFSLPAVSVSGTSISGCSISNNPSPAVSMADGMIRDSLLYGNSRGLILGTSGTVYGGLTITTSSGPAIEGTGRSIAPSSCNGTGC